MWTQPAITCSKSTIETLEQVVNMFKVNNKDTRTTPLPSFWCLYCWLWTYFTPCSVSIFNFEQVNADWVSSGFLSFWDHCTKKWSFPFRISSANVRFGHIYWGNSFLIEKFHFLCSGQKNLNSRETFVNTRKASHCLLQLTIF